MRGGGPDQNLVLLDEATIYNTGHLFGFFSVFNSDAIKDVTLVKGGAPANYGGRLSSVMDVSMKEGNMKEYHATGGIGLIASRLTLEGPIKKDRGSFMLAGRRTYIDAIARPFSKRLENTGYYFYDLNLKANYKIGEKDRLYLSGYWGVDKFKFANERGTFKADIPWGNKTATFRWNHQFNAKPFADYMYITTTISPPISTRTIFPLRSPLASATTMPKPTSTITLQTITISKRDSRTLIINSYQTRSQDK